MASEKMSAILAILHELRKHCETSIEARKLLNKELDRPSQRSVIECGWQSENSSIGALCDLLEITIIPDEERNAVISVVSELAAMKGSHLMLGGLLKSLKRS